MIDLISVDVRHEKRVRLLFSNNLAIGAFVPGLYVIDCPSGQATAPLVVATLIVPGSPNVVELSFSIPMVQGVAYSVSAVGVPASDASVTGASSVQMFNYGAKVEKHYVEPALRDRERLLYGADIIFDGNDFVETPGGDLERIEGKANVTKAVWRGVESPPLPHDPTWGVYAREYVDSPTAASMPLKGALIAQVMRDPRVRRATASVEVDKTDTYIHITPVLIGNDAVEDVTVSIPNDS